MLHSRLLNAFVRQDPGLLEKSLSKLLKARKLMDFDNKRSYFYSRIRKQHEQLLAGPLQVDQNAVACVDERVALANLIANLTLDMEENKTVLKQLKKANATLTQELTECKSILAE
ncbi:hypothetical protein Tco_0124910, partial [Tanacetum coccineum]